MLTIFNRKELLITMDFNEQADVRSILSANNIPYATKTTNLTDAQIAGSRRGYQGSFGIKQSSLYQYKIYVHKNDYEKAKHLIR